MGKYTREEKRENKRKNKIIGTIASLFVGMFLCITIYLIYNLLQLKNVEDILRYIIIGILGLICLIVIIKNFTLKAQPKKYKFIVFILLLLVFGAGEYFLSYKIISKGLSILDKMTAKEEVKYTSALIKLSSNEDLNKNNINTVDIGIISNEDDVEGYILAQKIIKKYDISTDYIYDYDDYITMLKALYSGEISACFVSGDYVNLYKNTSGFEEIKNETEVVAKYSKMMKKQKNDVTATSTVNVTEPFTILLMGVDSTDVSIDSGGLGDTLMLVTFNPKTLNATVFSIPRDTYVPISCYGNALSKITHAASGGDSCVISTVQNFTGINIDSYAKINFQGLIRLVDALGGIDVDVPYSFCETDENRMLANTIFVEKGWQHLNGQQALALARNRKYYPTCGSEWNDGDRNDFVRGQNQQIVVKGILRKIKTIRSIDQFYDILDAVSASLETNLSREQILDFYNVFKKTLLSTDSLTDGNDVISMQRTYLNGSGGIILDHIAGTGLYEFVPSQNSLNAILTAMRINLEIESETYPNSFTFSIDNPYEASIIGADEWGGVKYYEPWVAPVVVTCGNNEELGADGATCVCVNGYEKNSYGSCVKEEENSTCKLAGNGEEASNTGGCQCPSGYQYDDDDKCVKIIETDDEGDNSSEENNSSSNENNESEENNEE